MFELSVASKYLTPRWRQLSVSIISIVSILVIALVVWLIVVFFSVTHGLEKSWIQKLIALTAPVRITPTNAYYNSYYYQVDSLSAASNYTPKSISEKLSSWKTDPYDPTIDAEMPRQWQEPLRNDDGSIKDLTKLAFHLASTIPGVPGLAVHDFEVTPANLQLISTRTSNVEESTESYISQGFYFGSFDSTNTDFADSLQLITMNDLTNLMMMLSTSSTENLPPLENKESATRIPQFFKVLKINALKTPPQGWLLPKNLLQEPIEFQVYALMRGPQVIRVMIPHNDNSFPKLTESMLRGRLSLSNGKFLLHLDNSEKPQELPNFVPIAIEGNITLPAVLNEKSLQIAKRFRDLQFSIEILIQGHVLKGEVPLSNLLIAKAIPQTHFEQSPDFPPLWVYHVKQPDGTYKMYLPSDTFAGEGIILPKSIQDTGKTHLGDRGYISYYAPTASSIQEQKLPVYVAGFYDQGIIPVGGKFVITKPEIVSTIRNPQGDNSFSNGFNVRFNDLEQADAVKHALESAFKKEGIDPYWKIETYQEYEFTKDLMQQLRSERNLWTLIATVIIIVACSNIISMLIILVNDKKEEIGILRSMGAPSYSIATIFGFCGMVMGALGSIIGTALALMTLKNLQELLDFIGSLQGYEVFNPLFYGKTLPNQISMEALTFVIITTAFISLLAGIVPALKACLLRPSAILKSE